MNKSKVLNTLKSLPPDRWIRGSFFKDGNYCSVGWLLHTAGMLDSALVCLQNYCDNTSASDATHKLEQEYGIGPIDIIMISTRNDKSKSYDDMIERLEALGE